MSVCLNVLFCQSRVGDGLNRRQVATEAVLFACTLTAKEQWGGLPAN